MSDFVTDLTRKAAFLRLEDELAKANEIIKRLNADLATSDKHKEFAEAALAKAQQERDEARASLERMLAQILGEKP